MAPPQVVLDQWDQLGKAVQKTKTVAWKPGADAVKNAHEYYTTSRQAREFARNHACSILDVFLGQIGGKLGKNEKSCVERAAGIAVDLALRELFTISNYSPPTDASRKEAFWWIALGIAFDPNKPYYKATGRATLARGAHRVAGFPHVRKNLLSKFARELGIRLAAERIRAMAKEPATVVPFSIIGNGLAIILIGVEELGEIELNVSVLVLPNAIMSWITCWTDEYLETAMKEQKILDGLQDALCRAFDKSIAKTIVKTRKSFSRRGESLLYGSFVSILVSSRIGQDRACRASYRCDGLQIVGHLSGSGHKVLWFESH